MTLRRVIKGTLERALTWSGATIVARRQMRGRVLIVAYHNVVPDDAPLVGDVANHLPVSAFIAQVTSLARTHEVIPLGDVFREHSTSSRPRAVITFDDAYRGAVVYGLAELIRLGLPATVFVAPAFIGGRSFWWDALARDGGGLDPELREHALTTLRGEDASIRNYSAGRGYRLRDVPDYLCASSESELLDAARMPGISLGSHTWGHPNLARLDADELRAELTKPLAWLNERVANPLSWIAYPYGFYNETVERAAEAAGYDGGLAISGGWYDTESSNRFHVPRINVPRGLSLRGFALRGAGLLSD